jgi:hypothetical protein
MKKIIVLLALVALTQMPLNAQFVQYGGQIAGGASYVTDDLLTSSPIFAFTLGGYADYMFTEWKNPWAENVYIRTGLNINRRGTNFTQELIEMTSIRRGYFHNWYAQIPVIFGFRYELPSLPAGNYLNFFFGPSFSVGLFGRRWDRQVTLEMPQYSNNYDTYVTGTKSDRASFKHLRRLDASVILGVGYQWHNFTFDIYMDHGFVALMKRADVLAPYDVAQNKTEENMTEAEKADRNAYTGTNQAFMLSIGYQLPINR